MLNIKSITNILLKNKMKRIITLAIGLTLSLSSFAQFFDSVPYRGAFGVNGSTKGTVNGYTGYNPDVTNNNADWTKPWANFAPNAVAYPGDAGYNSSNSQFYTIGGSAQKVTISSDITADYTMTSDKWYELSGLIHVTNGATLTIQAGTCIRGNATNLGGLIISQGSKIMAVSDKDHPVVMTSGKATGSRVRGDWAGLLILGKASINAPGGQRRFEALPADPLANYGGIPANDADNSGSIRYMRVEFAGYNYLPDQEINGVTFGGVGSSSHFDYIQSSFANDDAYEWFGGTCSHKFLIAFSGTDDDFDMDEGYNGKLQYLLGLRNAGLTETSPGGACNGLEHDNNTNLGTPSAVNPNITAPVPTTTPTISNMTLVGPEHPGAVKSSLSTLWQQRGGEAFRLRTNDATGVFNSITWGYATLINLPNVGSLSPSVQTRAADDELCIRNTAIITSNGDLKFNSSNYPTSGWATGVTAWTGIGNVRNWIMNGPTVSIYNYLGATSNDTLRTSVTNADITNPDYIGASNGPLSGLRYDSCDFTLTTTSSFLNSSSFQHPRIALVPQKSIAVSTTNLPNFNQIVGNPTASKIVIVKTNALSSAINVNAPSGFEVSANGTTGWAASFVKGTTATDTLVFVRLNRLTAGSTSGYVTLASSNSTPEFSTVNISVSGTAVAPATPFINASTSSLSFTNGVGSSAALKFNTFARNLTNNVSVTAPTNFEVSTSSSTGFSATLTLNQSAGKIANTTIFVRYNPTIAGNHNGTLVLATAGADSIKITLSGMSTPMINVLPGTVTLGGAFQLQYPYINIIAGTPSVALPIVISGSMLTDTVKVNVPTNFQMSTDSTFIDSTKTVKSPNTLMLNTNMSATLNQIIFIRYAATTTTTNAGNLTVYSTGAPVNGTGPASQVVSLSARASSVGTKNVNIFAPSYQLKFSGVLGLATPSQIFAVAGSNLGTDSLVVNAPTNWEISLTGTTYTSLISLPNTAGFVVPTPIYVRYNPTVSMALNQFVIVNVSSAIPLPNTNNATNVGLLVFGVATPTVTTDLSSLPTFYTAVGKPSYANSIMVGGYNLTNNVNINASNGFEISKDTISFSNSVIINQTAGVAANTKVYVRYTSNTAGAISGNYVNISTQNGSSIPVMVSGIAISPALPVLSLSTATLPAFNTKGTVPTAPVSFTVSALNLVAALNVTVGNDFELSNDSITYKNTWSITPDVDGNIANTKLFCRFKRATTGSSSDSIKFSSTNLLSQTILVSGKNTVGISEINGLTALNLYPNPASQSVSVDFMLNENGNAHISIIDLSGKSVGIAINENFTKGLNTVELPIVDLKNGFYFVTIVTDKGTKTAKLSVIK